DEMTIAQRFIAGFKMVPQETSPVGTTDQGAEFIRPSGTLIRRSPPIPAMNRWAIVIRSLRDDGGPNGHDDPGAPRPIPSDLALYY
ncbi:MAG: hypothetical protein V3W34_02900, partial [Phycisphaerae bacterium]